uniref:Lectin 2 n=1 Tax=Ocimum basilicum TaxID=39350 RepID=A0A2K8BHX4_OCIBA|nr:lectin 2 [Ocimum basilicum]
MGDNYFPKVSPQGDAMFLPGTRYLRLIKTDYYGNPQSNSIGRAVISNAVQMKYGGVQVDFESVLKFRVAAGDSPDTGSGIAFFIAPENYEIPPNSTGDNYGIFDPTRTTTSHVFAVVFNTQEKTVGINIESPTPRKSMLVNGLIGNDVKAHIKYDAVSTLISVDLTIGQDEFKPDPLTLKFDLSPILDDRVTIGVSATTADILIANHDALVWSVKPNA